MPLPAGPMASKELDVVKLHSNMCKNIRSNKMTFYKKKKASIETRLRSLEQKKRCLVTGDGKRKDVMPVLRELRYERLKLASELREAEEKLRADHHTDYLLQAIPILNTWHKLNASLASETEEAVRQSLMLEKCRLIDRYVSEFFPHLKKRIDQSKRTMLLKDRSLNESKCCKAPVVQNPDSGLVCNKCGLVIAETAIIISNPSKNLSYNRNISPYKCYSYKRVNHLREYLRQITGKTMISMTDEEMQRVRDEVAKQTISIERVNADYVRRLLKRLKLNAHYEQATSIARVLNPRLEVLDLEPDYEERLVLQFVTLEKPFERIRSKVDKSRKNFLSYSYVFARLNQMNGRSHLNKSVRLLKSVRLIIKQDAFWRLICKELAWEYLGNSVTV